MTLVSKKPFMTIEVKVIPKSGRDEILGVVNGMLKVRVSAPPIKGKANERLTELISKTVELPRSSITIIKGRTLRTKTISTEGVSKSKLDWFKKT